MPTENEFRYFKVSFATLAAISATRKNIKAEDMRNMNFQRLVFVCLLFKVIWKWKSLSCVRLFATPRTIHPWNSPGQNTGMGSISLLQGLFLTQGSNPGLLHCRWILYQLSHKGSLRILEWVAYPLSRREPPNPEIELGSPVLQADSLPAELPGKLYMYQ